MEHTGVSKIVRLLQAKTTLSAINDKDDDVQGVVEAYRFVEYTKEDGSTSHDVEYRVLWTDGVYEWISWSEANTYNPVRPLVLNPPTLKRRERVNA